MFGFNARRSAGARGRVLHHRAGKLDYCVLRWGYAACSSVELASTSARLISITTM